MERISLHIYTRRVGLNRAQKACSTCLLRITGIFPLVSAVIVQCQNGKPRTANNLFKTCYTCIFGALILGENIWKLQYLIAFLLISGSIFFPMQNRVRVPDDARKMIPRCIRNKAPMRIGLYGRIHNKMEEAGVLPPFSFLCS